MWIRFKRWRYLSPLAPHVEVCQSGRRYLWDGQHEGVTNVPFRSDAEDILNPPGDRQSDYTLAYEKYGITFDAQGKEIEPVPFTPSNAEAVGSSTATSKVKTKK